MSIEFQTITFLSNTPYFNNQKYEIPKKCPHCTVVIAPTNIESQKTYYDVRHDLNFILHCCTSCDLYYLTTHLRSKTSPAITNFISIYPEVTQDPLSVFIEEFSPRFAQIYKQAATAENLNHIELAATGYRMSLEILAKDFAIYENPDQEEEIKKATLNNCLQTYYKDFPTSVAGHVVKTLGNDYAHYIQKHMDVDFQELKYYLNIFLLNIEMQLRLKHPPVPVPDLKENN